MLQGGVAENVDVMDASNLLIETETGAQGSFQMSYISIAHPLLLRVELHGEQASILYELRMDNDTLQTRIGYRERDGAPLVWEKKTQRFSAIMDQLCSDFLRGAAGKGTQLTTMHDGLQAQAIIEAAKNAIASGCWANVSYT